MGSETDGGIKDKPLFDLGKECTEVAFTKGAKWFKRTVVVTVKQLI